MDKNTAAAGFRTRLLVTTMLSTGALALLPFPAFAQTIDCTVSGSTCTFSNGSTTAEPFSHTNTGTAGSGSTAGGEGDSYTYNVDSNIDVSVSSSSNPDELAISLRVYSNGGAGSDDGPSSGGDGGTITYNAPSTTTLNYNLDANSLYDVYAVQLGSLGGNGADDNTNNKSNGGAGGNANSVTYDGDTADISLVTTETMQISQASAAALFVEANGGFGGRGNESSSFTPDGGNGGNGGDVTVNSGGITVGSAANPITAAYTYGIYAQSVGGRGPNDYNSSDDETQGGGGASTGGDGASVTVNSYGFLNVTGASTDGTIAGIYALSGGGEGGWSYDVGLDSDFTDGGDGGNGGAAKAWVNAAANLVQTGTTPSSKPSATVMVLSSGGAGGVGQSGTTGGTGGNGGTATIEVTSSAYGTDGIAVSATGTNVDVLFANSSGGEGGAGLDNANTSTGGTGGNGGAVSITVSVEEGQTLAAISSSAGSDSGRGIVGQSIGNFGGQGSDGNAVFGSPGSAGDGGNGGTVSVTINSGAISTDGTVDADSANNFAHGVLAQSVGGGGGDGGDFQGLFGGSGGAGGKGGNGDTVSVTNAGDISANGIFASGIVAQSIGGGGGEGGVSDALVVALGGSGGSGGESGAVTVTNSGTIETSGFGAMGIMAQSIVGAGGSAGVAAAAVSLGATAGSDAGVPAGTTTVANTGTITTQGDAAIGILAQSIGGGGGSATGTPSSSSGGTDYGIMTIGGAGSDGGAGGEVDITDIGTITTSGGYAHGLLAQSVGGGGGNGGNAFSASILSVPAGAIGGASGGGGDGGLVQLTNTAGFTVTTNGTAASGVVAHSVGGGGGTGGDASTTTGLDFLNLSMGGSASGGGTGGEVSVTLDNGTITTNGNRGAGVIAQSVGGGGGIGGSATNQAYGFLSIGVAAGGLGGGGGDASSATVSLTGTTIKTAADQDTASANDAIGVLVQSIGGGGGMGGAAASQAITTGVPIDPEDPDITVTVNAQFSMGGAAGDGGSGKAASATVAGQSSITTNGAGSHGMLVQSVGGGGGSGGDASSAATTIPDSTQTYGLTLTGALGGSGGDGGSGGTATATVGSSSGTSSAPTNVHTTGQYANAVVAQSIGGGGGNSGVPSTTTTTILGASTININLDLGSANLLSSEQGANGDTATVTLYGDAVLKTDGDGSRGVVAQSVGGGGGTVQGGEIGVSADANSEEGSLTGSATVNLGQKGGAGGDSGLVTVTTSAGSTITTAGVDADGIMAQSIGGGGGLAGSVGSTDDTADASDDDGGDEDDDISLSASVSVGGRGGDGGASGGVSINYDSTITTAGDFADGIVAQAIGGGGGTGGSAASSSTGETAQLDLSVGGTGGGGGDGGAVDVILGTNDASITTSGYMAHGLLLQSIGGGGGQGGDGSDSASGSLSVGASVGGSSTISGSGAAVSVTGIMAITTNGDDAYALVAQSIGGGGGIGGSGTSDTSDGGDDDYSVDVAVGGSGGVSGDGDTVTVNITTPIETFGARAFGILAQSIGGGGGIGGAGSADNLASVNLGGQGGAGGNGDTVSVTLSDSALTGHGAGGHMVIAQSIGGGGGVAGAAASGPLSRVTRSGGGSGNGGAVTVDISMTTIDIDGDDAFGILAQSIGGGGGMAGDSSGVFLGALTSGSGTGGTVGVSVDETSVIDASGGENAIGIVAQSAGASGSGNITLMIDGAVTGGTGDDGAGIMVLDGATNVLTINAGGSVVAGESYGTAVAYYTANSGGLVVDVYGTMTGNVLSQNAAGNSAVTVNNYSSNSITGASLYEANVVNRGRFVVGEGTAFERTRITGDFRQSREGTLVVGANFARGRAGTVIVEGDALVNGRIEVAAATLAPTDGIAVVAAEGALVGAIEAIDTRTIDYDARVRDGAVELSIERTRFAEAFSTLSPNQATAGRHLDEIFAAGSGRYARLLADYAALAENDASGVAYAQALTALSPGGSQAAAAAQAALAQGRLDKALSCPAFSADSAMFGEEACVWAEGGAAAVDQGGEPGYDGNTWGLAGGVQLEVRPDWFVGLAVGYEDSNYDSSDNLSSSDGSSGYAAVSVKREIGAFTIAGALSGSYGSYDIDRRVVTPGNVATASGNADLYTVSARARAAYTYATENAYVRPFLDVDLLHTNAGSYTESGAGLYNLRVAEEDQTALVVTPAIEIGGKVAINEDWHARLFASGGVSLSTEDSWTTSAKLAAAPAGTGSFETTLPIADVVGRIGAGLQITSKTGFDIRAEYGGAFGDDYTSHSGTFRLIKRF
ncbi:autotransporter outer membrane beta-barrel domain-containing protein [Acuticoccus kandeliae]|uniref:autotransporter outer membrane beta-barrel domain-containing protein n=1 Tax=Acuticoccus kandeliae TaxID=2073160 RepID=UPI00196A2F5F|nr:autotransporter outer membrane beta-barrel domain-containing protein [Acuticoccus kandeliae]